MTAREEAAALREVLAGQVTASTEALARLARLEALLEPGTPPVDPPPVVVDPPTPSDPRRKRVLWHYGWGGPSLDAMPEDVRGGLTAVTLAMCQSARAGTGKLADPPGATPGQVTSLVADGVGVTIGIGGAGDGGIMVNGTARVGELVTSVLVTRDKYRITGATWDLETPPGQAWTIDAVLDASRELIAAGLDVAIWSALYGGRLASWGAVAQGLGSKLGWWERGFYDFPEAADSRLTGIVTGDLTTMRRYVARDDQLVASFAPVGATSRTPVAVSRAAYTAAVQARATVGWSVWEDRYDSRAGWETTRMLAAVPRP